MALKFQCLRCGRCCHEIPFLEEDGSYKRIPIYPEEAKRLEILAEKNDIELHLIEDLVFPDIKNKKILILTWRIMLDNEEKVCPFFNNNLGCTIHEEKPLACQAYPLAIKTEDAFNLRIDIDPLCEFTIKNRSDLENLDFKTFKEIYQEEFQLAQKLLRRNKNAILELTGLEKIGEIEIPRQINPEDYNLFLQEWERIELGYSN